MTTIHLFALSCWLWLAAIHPALPWSLIPLSSWLVNWAIRRWAPELWERCARLGPGAVGSLASKAFQALPSVAMGAIVSALASNLDLRQTVLGALVALGAPIWHEALKAIPGPYRGGMPPAAVVLLLIGCGLSQTACSGTLTAAHTEGLQARRGTYTAIALSERCQSLDAQRTTWGAIEVGGVVLTGASGIGALAMPGDDRDVQRALAAGTLGAAVLTGIAVEVEGAKDRAWVREGCGQ